MEVSSLSILIILIFTILSIIFYVILKTENLSDDEEAGICKYCKKKIGRFKIVCKECKKQNKIEKEKFKTLVDSIVTTKDFSRSNEIKEYFSSKYLTNTEINDILKSGFGNLVSDVLEDSIITEIEEEQICSYLNIVGDRINLHDLPKYEDFVEAKVLKSIREGNIPEVKVENLNPVILDDNESIIMVIKDVNYYKLGSKTVYTGSSQGFTIRICKGVSYHTSSYRGEPTHLREFTHNSTGSLIFTNSNIYFYSYLDTVKINYKKLLSINMDGDSVLLKPTGKNLIMFGSRKADYICNFIMCMLNLLKNK